MNVLGIVYSASIAVLITLFFVYALKVRGPWGNLWTFFIVIMLAALAADLWLAPIGPNYREIYWIPPIITALLVASLLAASSPPRKPRNKIEQASEDYAETKTRAIALGAFFWFVVVFMLILVLIGLFAN